ncbi:AAA family ATPase [Flavobacterium psychrophilum]|uniref:AAA family ATPase n=1 Tax=Flavobacterium psychrophilum TaxID=96345 RepID=UPI0004F7DF67|nr:ATP-binding protein [Flavobacterium psychrophilum]AIN74065.1 ATPase AAA [Flavobacterium psychrophilum FPG3]EKT2070539.1 AAA family ATPase [Flavobacterium psychrophilum]EKT2072915.1 AAA family ATPase [Flavobacterium psychrophilum]EKT4492329.1 AAA family ATPase [Flavobacterium psychrophilum]MBF2045510.1 ATP-binding protein [Flavobacterium psychrophilum]
MLIRIVAKNLFSFKEETEFNLFPNKTQRLSHHKVKKNDFDILRLSAIYGANGSGKSNLIKVVSLLESMIVDEGKLLPYKDFEFKLKEENSNKEPSSIGIEFFVREKFYYYSISFKDGIIFNEYLAESKKEKDILIFERNYENDIQSINFFDGYTDNEKNKLFVDVLAEKLLQKDELLISFLNAKYKNDFEDIENVFFWFDKLLVIIKPDAKPGILAHLIDVNNDLSDFANTFIPSLNTGISKLKTIKKKFIDFTSNKEQIDLITDKIKKSPDNQIVIENSETGEEATLVYEEDEIFIKRLVTSHLNDKGNEVEFEVGLESDGTKRLIDYIPAIHSILHQESVYLIDEIERSIHPITIKEIISKISLDKNAKGQLIFTTHESSLLDQEILRPDEIWFAQKDIDGSSKLYSLSDFNIHNTANIENGYLNGRYGGIPFLTRLQDLNWHKYEVS